jgi:hypothetical protein
VAAQAACASTPHFQRSRRLRQPDGTAAFDPAMAIAFTILREKPSGSTGGAVIFGSQQYAPPLDVMVR